MALEFNSTSRVDPRAYTPLLSVIAKGESGGNYNAHFGNPANTTTRFTDMTIAEVLDWQTKHVAGGSISNAVGKYQIIQPTLMGLVAKLEIKPNERFDEAMQDRLAIALLEQRGANEYVSQKLSREAFAANIAKEWAALPKVSGENPERSYYSGDGVNASNITIDEVLGALDAVKEAARRYE